MYVVDLTVTPSDELLATLSADERERGDRFIFERDRRAFIRCRGRLRQLLGSTLNRDPACLTFTLGPYDKPHLHDDTLAFNVSHSHEIGLIAISDLSDLTTVGVDIERHRELSDLIAISRRYFTLSERQSLITLPTELRTRGFFCGWSRKEAFIKAVGMGFSFPLKELEVTVDPRKPAQIVSVSAPYSRESWEIYELEIHPEYSAALVTPIEVSIQVIFEH